MITLGVPLPLHIVHLLSGDGLRLIRFEIVRIDREPWFVLFCWLQEIRKFGISIGFEYFFIDIIQCCEILFEICSFGSSAFLPSAVMPSWCGK